jgi:hypothetical protein
MWIVVVVWSDYEVSVEEFLDYNTANEYYNEYKERLGRGVYLAKVEKKV